MEATLVKFQDFEPKVLKSGGLLSSPVYESMQDVMLTVNELLADRGVELINIETVVLPNIHSQEEEGTQDTSLTTLGVGTEWNQFIRVWYRES